MNIFFSNAQSSENFNVETEEAIMSAITALSVSEGLDFCFNLQLTDNLEITRLNNEFRGVNSVTDVLSFPAYELCLPLKCCIQNIELEYEGGVPFIGDIAISLERAAVQAMEIGNSYLREVVFLTVHGALHLLGYDHDEPEREDIMMQKQREIMDAVNL